MQLDNLQERAFYIQQSADEGWTVRFMQRMIRTGYYHQVALGSQELIGSDRAKSGNGLARRGSAAPTLSTIGGTARTRLASIRRLLLERYVGYAFVAQRQFVSVGGAERWAELVFFHFVLNRFILIQLGHHDPTTTAQFRLLLDAYIARQPPTVTSQPIGFLIDPNGLVKIQTTSYEPVLPAEEESTLPRSFQ
jgi:predicted nuclease of restriction endonuclease-like (RecB) superfamily